MYVKLAAEDDEDDDEDDEDDDDYNDEDDEDDEDDDDDALVCINGTGPLVLIVHEKYLV